MLGETLALLAAVNWAVSIVLFRKSERFSAQGINLFKNVLASALLLLTLLVLGSGFDTTRSAEDWSRLIFSGVIGISIADTLIFTALRKLGASLYSVMNCGYAPIIVALSVVFLGEPVGLPFLVGGVLVVTGVLVVASDNSDPSAGSPTSRADFVTGFVWGTLGLLGMGFGVILVKPVLASGGLVEITAVRMLAGVAGQLVWILFVPSQREALSVFKPDPAWRSLVPGAFLGSYVAMLLWLGGFKWALASVASVLNQLASVFTIVLARIFLGEALTPRRMFGAGLAIAGAIWIVVSR